MIYQMTSNLKYLIIPDVHGRDFWIEPLKYVLKNTDAKIIFLGDYLDVYLEEFQEKYEFDINDYSKETYEKFNKVYDDAIENFKSIIEFKKENPDRIILLLGNHDCGYSIGDYICNCRKDKVNARQISKLFDENKDLFQLAHEDYINDKHFIFSHAGINKKYAKDCFGDEVNEKNVVTLFNNALREENYGILNSLGYYSRFRGRFGGDYGSIIWADAREWFYGQDDTLKTQNEPYGFSIVGHSIMSKPYITENMAFLDTQEAHCLLENGEILTFKNYIESNE